MEAADVCGSSSVFEPVYCRGVFVSCCGSFPSVCVVAASVVPRLVVVGVVYVVSGVGDVRRVCVCVLAH